MCCIIKYCWSAWSTPCHRKAGKYAGAQQKALQWPTKQWVWSKVGQRLVNKCWRCGNMQAGRTREVCRISSRHKRHSMQDCQTGQRRIRLTKKPSCDTVIFISLIEGKKELHSPLSHTLSSLPYGELTLKFLGANRAINPLGLLHKDHCPQI